MIVWGGRVYSWGSALDTGGRYDPANGNWSPLTTTDAPTARTRHTAVWTGDEMIVWGGWGAETYGNGGKYDPASDAWLPVSELSAPDARRYHTAAWTGSEMIVWGGLFIPSYTPTNTGGRYDPDTDTWSATTTEGAPVARSDHTAVWTGASMIVFGGEAEWGLRDGSNYVLDTTDSDSDGVADSCDCAPNDPNLSLGPPADVSLLTLESVGVDGVRISWSPVAGADHYSLTRGPVASFPGGDYGPCLDDAIDGTDVEDHDVLDPGSAVGYLVQATSATCGASSLGVDSDGVPRINDNPDACP
jgi:hypothetical protein